MHKNLIKIEKGRPDLLFLMRKGIKSADAAKIFEKNEKNACTCPRTRVVLYTLALAKKCEVADTPTGVVMMGVQGIRMEHYADCLKTQRRKIHGERKSDPCSLDGL